MPRGLTAPVLACAAGLPGLAGGVFYNSNQSAEYIRCLDRNSALDAADIAYYNMAGTVRLRPGFSCNLSNQTILQRATVRTVGNPALGDRAYGSRNPVWLVPNGYAVYRGNGWAAFTSLQSIGATAVRHWPDGLPNLDLAAKREAGYGGAPSRLMATDAYLDTLAGGGTPVRAQAAAAAAGLDAAPFPARSWVRGRSAFLAWRHGAALRLGPRFALALAGRLVYARQELQGEAVGAWVYARRGQDGRAPGRISLDVDLRALGYSGEAGLDWFPAPGLVLSLTWEQATRLRFGTSVRNGRDGGGRFQDGRRARLDLPQAWRFGCGWQAGPRWRVALGVNAYLEHSARLDLLDDPGAGIEARRDYRDTWEEAVALEWRAAPRWLLSLGISVNQIGQRRAAALDVGLAGAHADYLSLGAGFRYQATDRWRFTAGAAGTGFARRCRGADGLGDRPLKARFAALGAAADPRKDYDKRYLTLAFGVECHLPR